jgi:hypothetical protein
MMYLPPQYDFSKNNKMMAMAIMVALGVILHRLETLLPPQSINKTGSGQPYNIGCIGFFRI